jgi:DNA-binding SARP family transcriptional activator/tetratricopeptide (TPR) repeat protein
MRFRVLGPLEVSDNGRQIDLPGGKQRALLCTLLLDANRVVSVDRLIDALWDEAPPETAVKALQVHVSQLRKAIGNRVHRRGGGYLVAVDSHELDLLEFTDLVASGDYRAALRLWRGSPLPELGGAHFAAGEIARLEELRVNCVERRIEAELAAGHGAELVGELESLVHLHPLRERLRGQLMLALYRSGRQADALEAFQAARTALVDELGLEPGRELRDLHQRILNQDVDLDAAAAPAEVSEKTTRKEEHEPAVTATRETRKMVTVLCAAIEAAGAGEARLDPEALRHMVGRVTDEIRSAVGRYEGTVVSEAGDAVTGIFGIPTAHEDDAVRAIRAAAEIAAAAGTLASELADTRNVVLTVGLGVGTGEVVVGGDLQPAGEPLSAAMRLARRSSTGDVLLDEQTHRLARGDVAASAATGAYVLVDATPVTPGRIGGRRSAMVGRERELRRLGDALAQAVADRSCQLFTILGAAGVGKSRLVDELLGRIDDARVCRGRCLPYGEGITYWPVLEIVRDAVGIEDGDSPDDALERLTSSLGETDDPQRLARNLAELIGLSDGVLAAEDARTAVRVLIETIARDRPAIVVFDDIHWGESAFLDLVEHLAEWTRDSPTLLLCLARPELLDVRPSWGGGKLNATSILLQPLSDDESARLIDILDGVALDGETRNRIIAGAGGNPLFVEEMLALALEDEHGSERSVPPTIQALLAARLDRLGETERLALECAAVGGKVFYEEAVVELAAPLSAEQVEAALGTLMRKELIRLDRTSVGGRTYGFRHMLIRDAAYDAIPKHARADLHERFGRWLEQMASDRLAEYEEVVGYHLEQASLFLRQLGVADAHAHELARAAATRLGTAGRRAFIRSDAPAGVNLVSRAVALLPPEDPQRVELVPNVRVIQGLGVDFAFADRVLTEAVEAAATTGDRRLAANALVQRAFLRLFTEADVTADELLETARRAADVFEHLDDNLGLARAWRLIGQAHYLARRGHECAEASERAFAYARLAHDVFEQREILEWLAIAFFLGPIHAEEGVRRCEQLRELARGDAIAEVHILGAEAFLLGMLGRTDEALALLARGEELQAELGEWIWIYTWHSAAIHLWAGNAALAEAELRPPYEALKKLGERSHFSTMTHGLAMATYMQGRYDEAEELTRECEAAARANDVFSEIMWRAVRAKVFARTGRLDAAAMLATEAVALAKSGDFHVGTAEALMDLAEVEGLAGRPDNAAAAIEDALRYCALKGNLLAAERARTQLLGLQTAGFTGS